MMVSGGSIKVARAALHVFDNKGSDLGFIYFQYNPDNLTRKITPQLLGGDAQSRADRLRYTNAPVETIDLEAELDATDQPGSSGGAGADPVIKVSPGIQPVLYALQLLLYPDSAWASGLDQAGTIDVAAYVAPTVLFVWGNRVAPVRVNEIVIKEQEFDTDLNPIRAAVTLSMQVLNWGDVPKSDPAYGVFGTYYSWMQSQNAAGGYSKMTEQQVEALAIQAWQASGGGSGKSGQ